jgi:hypothetical protein
MRVKPLLKQRDSLCRPFLAPVACYMFFQSWAVVLQNIGCGLAMFYPPWVMAFFG